MSPSSIDVLIADGKLLPPSVPILFGRKKGLVFQHFAEEALGGIEIALRGQQEIDRVSIFVDRAVQITLLAADLT
jgi:hypothetical protein